MTTTTLGERIAAARRKRWLTQEDLAARLGCRNMTISRWERDRNSPPLPMLARLAAELGTTAAKLLK